MLAIYYGVIIIVGLLVSPVLLFKARARAGVLQKLGGVPAVLRDKFAQSESRPFWFHAVSVGEFNAVWPLLRQLHERYPELPIAISTTTSTGQALAKERAGSFASVFYFPYDLPWAATNWLEAVRPCAVAIAETEVWPGFYNQCRRRRIPLLILNGRISPRSFSRYSRLKWLFKPVFQCATRIIAQSQEEAQRYKHITDGGVPTTVSGNMKFDGLSPVTEAERQQLRLELGSPQGLVLVGGSTHEGEEAALLAVTRQLKDKGVALNLILVPRHPERFDRAAELIRQHGFRPRRFSANETFEDGRDIYLLDAIGHLTRFYSLADLSFVGGTLVPVGGHSLVEPCAYSVPVTCGPHVHKTRDVARALVETGALIIAHDKMELEQTISELALNAEKRRTMGEKGKVWLEKSQGAVARTLTAIELEGVIPESIAYAEVKR